MTNSSLDWELVDRAAEALGVKLVARKKWRQRGKVPYRWRFPIIKQTGGALSMDAFEKTPELASRSVAR